MAEKSELVEGSWSDDKDSDISYSWVTKMSDIQLIEQGINILEFSDKISKRNPDMEFRLIRRITETQFHNEQLKDYEPKLNKLNRYNNILPYKRTEVKLEEESDDECPYINASFINSVHKGNGERKFIATQGPLPETFNQFWKMVWSENVQCIMMLCNLRENDKVQCDQYWPSGVGVTQQYGKLSVTFEDEEIHFNSLYKRKMTLTKEQHNESRVIYQYQWSEWKDHGIPDENSINIIDELIDIMLSEYQQNRKSIVHCSAGVGRTGTLISLVNLVLNLRHHLPIVKNAVMQGITNFHENEQLKKCTISIFGIVRRLREQRWGMVHHSEQYGYLYKYMKIIIDRELQKIGANQLMSDSQDQSNFTLSVNTTKKQDGENKISQD
ncbi:hypothetical protein ABPG74_001086 [Tetrahymena malaccensis]